ncbi:putative mitochondrial protein [Tanacetum coccineum]
MNEVFKAFLRKFALVLFDDILVYNYTLEDHVSYFKLVLETMMKHKLYAKQSKYVFGTTHVEYLGHAISTTRVSTEPNKVKAMQDWPIPSNIKQLKGFLGLTGYYRRHNYPFEALKKAMMEALVLGLPDFDEPFVIKTHASEVSLGEVLQQKRWRGYLLDKHFLIKTDHFSLKYLLDQRITTPTQTKWLPRLMGHNNKVVYKKGSDNGAADALYRLESGNELLKMFVSTITTDFMQIVVGQNVELRRELLQYFHEGSIGGYYGIKGKDVIMVVVDRLIYKLHGLPKSIISDGDKIFLSAFWKELFKALRDKLLMSTTHHPPTDGQTEVVNRCLEDYLRCMTGEHPKDSYKWLLLAKLWYNKNVHTSINTTPFEVDYGQTPPIYVPYFRQGKQRKFSPKFYGPFEVSAKLKKYRRAPLTDDLIVLPQCEKEGSLLVQPLKLLDIKIAKKINVAMAYGLMQWANGPTDDASWEDLGKFVK